MFRFLTVAASFLACVLLAVTPLKSADPPCVPDCPQSAFLGPFKKVMNVGGDCVVEVTYWRRLACMIWQDVAITEVRVLPPFHCNIHPTSFFLELVTRNLLVYTTPTLPQDTCRTQYRVPRASCWRSDTTNDCGDTIMVPCSGEGCCVIQYRICGDTTEPLGKSVTPVAILSTGTCTDTGVGSTCEPVCDTSMIVEMVAPTDVKDDVTRTASLSIAPNPAAQTVRISAPLETFMLCDRIAVIDVQGRRLAEVAISPSQHMTGYIDIDISDLGNGAYFVTCSGSQTTLSNQFTIQR